MGWADAIRVLIVVLSALVYGYASLTILRHRNAERAAHGVIAVYAFVVGVSQVTVIGDPWSDRTLLALLSAVVATAWFVVAALRDRRTKASRRRG